MAGTTYWTIACNEDEYEKKKVIFNVNENAEVSWILKTHVCNALVGLPYLSTNQEAVN